ncbi:MAG TPA: protease pro-enzyme activation domain-containing protein, partial [Acidisarcina sp.]
MFLAPRKSALLCLLSGFCFVTVTLPSHGQPGAALSQTVARITSPIKESTLVTLGGNTHPLAQSRYDQGAAPVSMPTGRMMLVLKRSDRQEAALKAYLAALQTPGSTSYHKYLTPEQFGARYGTADADIQAVSMWLQG